MPYPRNTTTNIRLEISGIGLDPGTITAALGICPTRTGHEEAPTEAAGPSLRSGKVGFWQTETGYRPDADINSLVTGFVNTLAPLKDRLCGLLHKGQAKGRLVVEVYVENGENIGTCLGGDALRLVAGLGLGIDYELWPLPHPLPPEQSSLHVAQVAVQAIEKGDKEAFMRAFATPALEGCTDMDEGWAYMRDSYSGSFVALRDVCLAKRVECPGQGDEEWWYLSVKDIITTKGSYRAAFDYCLYSPRDMANVGLHGWKLVAVGDGTRRETAAEDIAGRSVGLLSSGFRGIWHPDHPLGTASGGKSRTKA